MNRGGLLVGLGASCAVGLAGLVGCSSSSSGAPYQGSLPPGLSTDGGATDGAEGTAGDAATESSTSGEAGAGGTAEDGAATDGPAACNTLVNAAPTITSEDVASAPPTLVGGTIVNGTYFLTALTQFTGDAGMSGAGGSDTTTIAVSGTTIQVNSSGTASTERVTTSGTTFVDTRLCPGSGQRQGTFTATSTMLIVQFDQGADDAGTDVIQETFTLQP
jgi:hypothetical protein